MKALLAIFSFFLAGLLVVVGTIAWWHGDYFWAITDAALALWYMYGFVYAVNS